jgi:excisionase family DNA binding protein
VGEAEALVSTAEAARLLGVHPSTLNRLAREGKLTPAGATGTTRRHYRWSVSELRREFRELLRERESGT